jgi:hypothetical protein
MLVTSCLIHASGVIATLAGADRQAHVRYYIELPNKHVLVNAKYIELPNKHMLIII